MSDRAQSEPGAVSPTTTRHRGSSAPGAASPRTIGARAPSLSAALKAAAPAVRRAGVRPVGRWTPGGRRGSAGAGRARRWSGWARSIADRFRPGRRRGAGAALVLGRPAGAGGGVVERIIERAGAPTLFAPRIRLTVAPLLRFERGAAGSPVFRPPALRFGAAAVAAPGGTASGAAPTSASAGGPPARRPPPAPLERARRRGVTGPLAAALPPAALRHRRLPAALPAAEPLALARRLAGRAARREARPRPAAAALHRPPPLAPPQPVEAAPAARARRRLAAATAAAADSAPGIAAGALRATPGEIDRLTDQVVRRIDRRMAAWRERTGRVR